jgi:hypothetical protein
LLGRRRASPRRLEALRTAVRDATAALVERIRRGDADAGPFHAAVRAHVRETVGGQAPRRESEARRRAALGMAARYRRRMARRTADRCPSCAADRCRRASAT